MRHELAIRGGLIATATESFHADIGIRNGRIVTIAEEITDAEDVIDATGHIVMPGGIEAHCHIAQESGIRLVTIHGRTRTQMYRGQANWQEIRQVVEAVSSSYQL